MGWRNIEGLPSRKWKCGFCGADVGGNSGYMHTEERVTLGYIYPCPVCRSPTYFDFDGNQHPGICSGADVSHLPPDIAALYDEIRSTLTVGAHTASVLASRKMLMHIAVNCGAEPDLQFAAYVDYLAEEGYVPPNGRSWVDEIRKKSNDLNHQIIVADRSEAEQLLDFIEMLLKFIYEFPARVGIGVE